MPIIPALWEADAGKSLEARSLTQPGQHGKTPCLLKIQKLARCVKIQKLARSCGGYL